MYNFTYLLRVAYITFFVCLAFIHPGWLSLVISIFVVFYNVSYIVLDIRNFMLDCRLLRVKRVARLLRLEASYSDKNHPLSHDTYIHLMIEAKHLVNKIGYDNLKNSALRSFAEEAITFTKEDPYP